MKESITLYTNQQHARTHSHTFSRYTYLHVTYNERSAWNHLTGEKKERWREKDLRNKKH